MRFNPDSNLELNLMTPESMCGIKEDSVFVHAVLSPLTLAPAKIG